MKKLYSLVNMMKISINNNIKFKQIHKLSDTMIMFYNMRKMKDSDEYKFNVYTVTKHANLFFLVTGDIKNDEIIINKKDADTLYIKFKREQADKIVDKRIKYIEEKLIDDILNKFKIKMLG